MDEVSGPVIAIALVLCAVFVPTAFISGITGQFFRQFALTIAISTVISAFNSLTLSPALASLLLRPPARRAIGVQRAADRLFGWFFRLFNRFFTRASDGYAGGVSRCCASPCVALVLYGGLMALTAPVLARAAGLRAGAGQGLPGRVRAVARRRHARPHRRGDPAHDGDGAEASRRAGAIAFPGLSMNGFVNAPNTGIAFVALKPAEERRGSRTRRQRYRAGLNQQFGAFRTRLSRSFRRPGAGARNDRRLQALSSGDFEANEFAVLRAVHVAVRNNGPLFQVFFVDGFDDKAASRLAQKAELRGLSRGSRFIGDAMKA